MDAKHTSTTVTKTGTGGSCTTTSNKSTACGTGCGAPCTNMDHKMNQMGHEAQADAAGAAARVTSGTESLGHRVDQAKHAVAGKVEEFKANH